MAAADTAAATARLSFLAFIPAGDAARADTAVFCVLNRITVGCDGGGRGRVIVSRLYRVNDVDVIVEDGRVAELLVAVVTLGLGVVLLQVHSQALDPAAKKGLGAEIFRMMRKIPSRHWPA